MQQRNSHVLENNARSALIYEQPIRYYDANRNFTKFPRNTEYSAVSGAKVALYFDVDNLSISAQKAGYEVDYHKLYQGFRRVSYSLNATAIYGAEKNDQEKLKYFEYCNIRPVPYEYLRAHEYDGDPFFMMSLSWEQRCSGCDIIILASGDGKLLNDCSRFIRRYQQKRKKLYTLSVGYSTSGLLNSRINDNIDYNIELGRDALRIINNQY